MIERETIVEDIRSNEMKTSIIMEEDPQGAVGFKDAEADSQTSKGESTEPDEETAEAPAKTPAGRRSKKRWVIVTAIVIILAAIAIALGVTLSGTRSSGTVSSTGTPETESSAPPPQQESPDDTTTAPESSASPPQQSPDDTTKPTPTKGEAIMDKKSWPELVGMPVSEAVSIIERERPDVSVQVILYNWIVTDDYVTTRVRVFKTEDDKVYWEPRIG